MKKIFKERVLTVWRLGYFKLFEYSEFGDEYTMGANGEEHEWKKLIWRFYWRVS